MLQNLKSWLFLLVLLLGGPVLVMGSLKDGADYKRLQVEGKDALGAVERIEWRKKHGVERGFKAHVVFKAEDGNEVQGDVVVSKEFGQSLKDGNAAPIVKVRYMPSDPHLMRAADATDDSTEMLSVGAVMFVIGAGWLGFKLRARKKPAVPEAATAA